MDFLTTILKLLLALILMAIGKLNFVLAVLLLMLDKLLPLKLLPAEEDLITRLLQTPLHQTTTITTTITITTTTTTTTITTLAGRTPEHGHGQVAVIFTQVIWAMLKPKLLTVVQDVKALAAAHTSRGLLLLTAG